MRFKPGLTGINRGRHGKFTLRIITVAVLAAVMIFPGLIHVAGKSAQAPLEAIKKHARLTVFMKLDAGEEEIRPLKNHLSKIGEITKVETLDSREVSRRFKRDTGLDALVSELDEPLPATVYIEMHPAVTPEKARLLAENINKISGVDLVVNNYRWEKKLLKFINFLSGLFWFIIALLAVVYVVVVFFATKVANETGRDFLNLKLILGATHNSIAGKFAVDNMLNGVLAGLLASLVITVISRWLDHYLPEAGLISGITINSLSLFEVTIITLFGAVCAFVTSWITCGLYLLKLEKSLRHGNL